MCESPVIVGIADIANYLRRSKNVIRDMIRDNELPVMYQRGAYMTSVHLLDKWLEQNVHDTNQ